MIDLNDKWHSQIRMASRDSCTDVLYPVLRSSGNTVSNCGGGTTRTRNSVLRAMRPMNLVAF
ncbi:hypothetical protein UFOVP1229_68 [uncultured Caudovirales phage]|uniref:Uncharacterized protein n=1 Tax=uncultured Caudovirales phage TaxID=2100421 RepID=A0A6J5R4H0_9CAUD|nr:hypothetical protein UFOVP1229_68 [uncultured Caudovirales phage]